jgi:hypothetical protein
MSWNQKFTKSLKTISDKGNFSLWKHFLFIKDVFRPLIEQYCMSSVQYSKIIVSHPFTHTEYLYEAHRNKVRYLLQYHFHKKNDSDFHTFGMLENIVSQSIAAIAKNCLSGSASTLYADLKHDSTVNCLLKTQYWFLTHIRYWILLLRKNLALDYVCYCLFNPTVRSHIKFPFYFTTSEFL